MCSPLPPIDPFIGIICLASITLSRLTLLSALRVRRRARALDALVARATGRASVLHCSPTPFSVVHDTARLAFFSLIAGPCAMLLIGLALAFAFRSESLCILLGAAYAPGGIADVASFLPLYPVLIVVSTTLSVLTHLMRRSARLPFGEG